MKITKELLYDLYIVQGKTRIEIAEIIGCSTPDTVTRKLKEYNINRRTTNSKKYKISDEEMRRLYEEEGLSIMEIAPLAGCGKSTVSRKLNAMDVDVNFRSLYTLNISKEEIKNLYVDDEMSVTEIAKIAGCTTSTISHHLDNMGIEKRPQKFTYKFGIPKEKMMELYLSGISSNQIGDTAGCTGSTVLKYLKEQGCPIREAEEYARVYEIDNHFFHEIDTPEKAYILGLIYADGCLESDRITICLTVKDSYLLKRIRNQIYPNQDRPIHYKETKHNDGDDMAYLYISSKKLANDIQKWGITPAKSLTLEKPNFSLGNLKSHFIRGYFDGDGWVTTRKRFGLVGTNSVISWLHQTLKDDALLESDNTVRLNHKDGHPNTVKVEYTKNSDFPKFYNYIYKDATLYLERKRLKFEAQLD